VRRRKGTLSFAARIYRAAHLVTMVSPRSGAAENRTALVSRRTKSFVEMSCLWWRFLGCYQPEKQAPVDLMVSLEPIPFLQKSQGFGPAGERMTRRSVSVGSGKPRWSVVNLVERAHLHLAAFAYQTGFRPLRLSYRRGNKRPGQLQSATGKWASPNAEGWRGNRHGSRTPEATCGK